MKYFFFFAIGILIVSCQPKDLPTVLDMSDGYALMKVSHMTTKSELKVIADKLASMEISMDYSGSDFFDDDKLQKLKLYVVTPEGVKGATTADIVALQFRYFGFLYQKDGSPSFKIGEL